MTITKPLLSSTEERVFKQCRLAHHMGYKLGFQRTVAGRKLRVGIAAHRGLEAYYLGGSINDMLGAVERELNDQYTAIVANPHLRDYDDAVANFQKDQEMLFAMVGNYPDWATEEGIDVGWETVSVEGAARISIEGAAHDLPVRTDLVQRNTNTGELRVRDFKTAQGIPTDFIGYQMSEQNGNYCLAVLAEHDELPVEFSYVFLRKTHQGPRTKPPYYHEEIIVRSSNELEFRVQEFIKVSNEIADSYTVYAAPDNCCGSWKKDWAAPCALVHAGVEPEEALEITPGYERKDQYDRYSDLTEDDE